MTQILLKLKSFLQYFQKIFKNSKLRDFTIFTNKSKLQQKFKSFEKNISNLGYVPVRPVLILGESKIRESKYRTGRRKDLVEVQKRSN